MLSRRNLLGARYPAAVTERVKLGVGAVNPCGGIPPLVGMGAANPDRLSDGRMAGGGLTEATRT